MTDEEYCRKLHEIMPFAEGMTPEEMMESQARLMIAQQQAYQANKGLFDRLWAEALQNDPLAVKRAQLQLRGSWEHRFKNWCAIAGP